MPRYKRLNRASRLQAAKHWIPKYEGKNILRGYKKHFGVSLDCALIELEILGIKLDPKYIQQVKQSEESRLKSRQASKRLRKQQAQQEEYPYSDDTFFFIAGYTENGFPYGVTWEEMDLDVFGMHEEEIELE